MVLYDISCILNASNPLAIPDCVNSVLNYMFYAGIYIAFGAIVIIGIMMARGIADALLAGGFIMFMIGSIGYFIQWLPVEMPLLFLFFTVVGAILRVMLRK